MYSSLSTQRDLQARYRQHLLKNIYLLNMRHYFSQELSRMINEELFEKPNQILFIHLSYYLVTIIDPKRAGMISWPLLEKKSENLYRTQFVNFCSVYFKSATVTEILPSHLVNAGGFKIIRLMCQLSEQALYSSVQKNIDTQSYQTELLNNSSKLSHCNKMTRKKVSEMRQWAKKGKIISELYKRHIGQLELECKCRTDLLIKVVDNITGFNESEKQSLKNVMKESSAVESWQGRIEKRMEKLFEEWRILEVKLLVSSSKCKELTEGVVMRHTLKNVSSHTLEYRSDKDFIDTAAIDPQVSAHQKSILKSIVKDNVLIFPNLLKAYTVVLGFLFKNVKLSNQMNDNIEILQRKKQSFTEIKEVMEELVNQVHVLHNHVKENAEQNTDHSYLEDEELMAEYKFINIPPLPRLTFKPAPSNDTPNMFTPINLTRIQFNIGKRRQDESSKPKSLLPPTLHLNRDRLGIKMSDIKSKLEGRKFLAPNFLPTPIPSTSKRLNHTALDVRATFSTEQINRLLSTRKSSFKKQSHNDIPGNRQAMRARLFNETIESGSPLYKCYSSPNLNEFNDGSQFVRQRRILGNPACQTVTEDSFSSDFNIFGQPISVEVSPQDSCVEESSLRLNSSQSLLSVYTNNEKLNENAPKIIVTTEDIAGIDTEKDDILTNIAVTPKFEQKNETKAKTSSIERILMRYKKVRESTLQPLNYEILQENNPNIANTENLPPLPDLLRSGYKYNSEMARRESLGQALGVDASFLDDFDLID